MKLFYIETFGCQMNVRDSERISSLLSGIGYKATDSPELADIILFNTCIIREKPRRKLYSTLGKLRGLKGQYPEKLTCVAGCLAKHEGAGLFERFPFVDAILGPHNIHKIPEIISNSERRKVIATEFINNPSMLFNSYRNCQMDLDGVKAFVTIMEGCDNACAYCVVPLVRGREVSRPHDDVIEEIRGLVNRGVKEVTLLGQNVNSYGKKEGFCSFPSLLKSIEKIDGLERIRFTTSNPKDISKGLIALFGQLKKLCPHIHLPLQSGSNKILRRMKRDYTREDFLRLVSELRNERDDIAITTDIIVGFPGEDDEDFKKTMEMMEEIRFDGHFSFKFSPMPGTLAYRLDGRVDENISAERLWTLQKRQAEIVMEKNSNLVGRRFKILVEGQSKRGGLMTGRTPCNRVVNFPGDEDLKGSVVEAIIDTAYLNSLMGRLAS